MEQGETSMTDSDCSAAGSKIPRGHHTPQHIAGVAALVAEGWQKDKLRRGVQQALAIDFAANMPGAIAAKFDCTRFGDCKCVAPVPLDHDDETGEPRFACFWQAAHDDVQAFYVRPDAWRIEQEERTVWIAEVNVTHHAGAEKWADLWSTLDCVGWTLRLLIVDRNGVRSEPFGGGEMFDALYAPLLRQTGPAVTDQNCRGSSRGSFP